MEPANPQSRALPPPRLASEPIQTVIQYQPQSFTRKFAGGGEGIAPPQSAQTPHLYLGPDTGIFANTYNRLIHIFLICLILLESFYMFCWWLLEQTGSLLPVLLFICGCLYAGLWWKREDRDTWKKKIFFLFYSLWFEIVSTIIFQLCSVVWIVVLFVQGNWLFAIALVILVLVLGADVWRLSRVIVIQACPKEQRIAFYNDVVGAQPGEVIEHSGADDQYCTAILLLYNMICQ